MKFENFQLFVALLQFFTNFYYLQLT